MLTEGEKNLDNISDGFEASSLFAFGFAFIPAGIITFIVYEKINLIKH